MMSNSNSKQEPIQEVFDLITDYEDWDVQTIDYGSVKTNAKGGKSVPILDHKKRPLVIRTPPVFNWGAQCNSDEATGRKSYRVSIQHKTNGTDEERLFYEKTDQFEKKVKGDSVKNCKEWFNKSIMSPDVVEALFNPMNKFPNKKGTKEPDYTRDPTLAAKFGYWNDKFSCEIYDQQENLVFGPDTDLTHTTFESFIPKGSYMSAVLQCKGIWFVNGKFGVTWQVLQCVVKKPYRIQGACYARLSTKEKMYMKKIEEKEKEYANQQQEQEETITDVAVEDSDEEEDTKVEQPEPVVEPEPEPEPEPVKEVTVPKKKKRIIKKKN